MVLQNLPEITLVKEIIRSRRQRDFIFGADLFGEPAWDILLEIYLAKLTETKMSFKSGCIASAVPMTTALRWIRRLQDEGWINRVADATDPRRSWLTLTEQGSNAMREYSENLRRRLG